MTCDWCHGEKHIQRRVPCPNCTQKEKKPMSDTAFNSLLAVCATAVLISVVGACGYGSTHARPSHLQQCAEACAKSPNTRMVFTDQREPGRWCDDERKSDCITSWHPAIPSRCECAERVEKDYGTTLSYTPTPYTPTPSYLSYCRIGEDGALICFSTLDAGTP